MLSETSRGGVHSRGRYSQGYDHSHWAAILPRNITPSDIDVVFDNMLRHRQLFCDFSVKCRKWSEKSTGQRLLYQQMLHRDLFNSACALCFHSTPPNKDIDTTVDVKEFQVMRYCNKLPGIIYEPAPDVTFSGSLWVEFVKAFYGLENTWGQWWI